MEKILTLLPTILRALSAFFAIANISCTIVAKRIANLCMMADFKTVATVLIIGMVTSFIAMTYVQFKLPANQYAAV